MFNKRYYFDFARSGLAAGASSGATLTSLINRKEDFTHRCITNRNIGDFGVIREV
jgi:hypothetical protein